MVLMFAGDYEVMTTYSSFVLASNGVQVEESEQPSWEGLGLPRVMDCFGNECVLFSEHSGHYAALRIEIWTDPPPQVDDRWQDAETKTGVIDTTPRTHTRGFGLHVLKNMGADDIADIGELPLPEVPSMSIQAWVLRDPVEQWPNFDYGARGLEDWLIRLWPS